MQIIKNSIKCLVSLVILMVLGQQLVTANTPLGPYITGTSSVDAYVTYTFTLHDCTGCSPLWLVANDAGTVVSSTATTAEIKFSIGGSQSVYVDLGPGTIGPSYFVTVSGGYAESLSFTENYVVKQPGLSGTGSIESASDNPANVLKQGTYSDALGRVRQVVSKRATPSQKDLVETVDYDAYGRVSRQYLPFESTDNDGAYEPSPETKRTAFYDSFYGSETHEYATSEYEPSPLNRPLKDLAPGTNWGGSNRGISYGYRFNTSSEEVGVWSGTTRSSTYATNKLYVNEMTDEHGNQTLEYFDVYGQLILKKVQEDASPSAHHDGWLCTYYVYDEQFRLTTVIPPKAVQQIKANSWVVSATVSDELLFHYTYDNLGRMISKEVPGAEPEEYVYDKNDRPVLMRTSNQASQAEWSFVMYDRQGRTAMTGTYSGSTSRSSLQNTMDTGGHNYFIALPNSVLLFSPYVLAEGWYYVPMPGLSSFNPESVMYYDDYSFSSSLAKTFTTAYNSTMSGGTHAETPAAYNFTQGLLTGSKTKLLGSATWEENVYLYDKKGRVIQTRTKNHKGGEDILTFKYDFSGKTLYSYLHHRNPDANFFTQVKSMTRYTYDHADRLIKLEMRQEYPSTATWQTVGEYVYDALGQLVDKKLGNNTQNVDYAYNIRGWLTKINDPSSIGSDYFGMRLRYDDASVAARQNYNGNIGEIEWRSAGDNDLKRYEYTYDRTNRLTSAYYNNLSDNVRDNDYTVNNITYDANGNIKTLRRYGEVLGQEREIDNLVYTYMHSDASNKLQRVADDPSQAFTIGDFKDGATGTTDYTYDNNGNMLKDLNKGMAANTTYNRLNLPEVVNFGSGKTITYKYTAGGTKVQKIINDGGDIRTMDYVSGFIYEDDNLQEFAHAEGRVRNNNNLLVYDYVITDHLGNSRVTFTTQASPTLVYKATMETDTHSPGGYDMAAYEEQFFYNLDASRVTTTSANYSSTLDDGCTNCNEGAQTNSSQRIGPAIILDVMPGDVVNLEVFAKATATGSYTAVGQSTLVNALVNAFVPSGLSSELGSETQSLFNSSTVYNAMKGGSPSGSNPRAYLNYVIFDQHFNVVTSGHDPVKSTAFHLLSFNNINISQKGYLYIWVSNENSQNVTVYFDDLKVSHTKSNILQEDHYYPFGMTMHGLSSTASLAKKNHYLYNAGTELTADFGWQMYDTPFRGYDAQLGRFHQVDPMAAQSFELTPYRYGLNNPIGFNDPLGLHKTFGDFLIAIFNAMPDKSFKDYKPDEFQALKNFYYQGGTVEIGDEGMWFDFGTFGIAGAVISERFVRMTVEAYPSLFISFERLNNNQLDHFLSPLFNTGIPILNAGSTLVGLGELATNKLRQFSHGAGPKRLARGLSKVRGQHVGTQRVASNLRSLGGNLKSLGTKIGYGGALLSSVDYWTNIKSKNRYEHANYWLGMGMFIASFNPVGAFFAVGYGLVQLGSYLYNGKTAEENIGRRLGF